MKTTTTKTEPMKFVPLPTGEREKLLKALRGNVEEDRAIHMKPGDTSFVTDECSLEDTINAIKSVPTHY